MFSGCPGFRVRFSGTMAWLTHVYTLSLFVSLFQTHTYNTQTARIWVTCFLLSPFFCKHGRSPNHCSSTLRDTWHPFNIKLLKTIRNLKMHNVLPLWASAWRPEEKFCFSSYPTWAFTCKWGKFHWVISRPALKYSNIGEYLTQVL